MQIGILFVAFECTIVFYNPISNTYVISAKICLIRSIRVQIVCLVVSKTKSYCSTTSKRKTQPFLRFGSLPEKRAE